MDIDYKHQINLGELQVRLEGQIMAKHSNEVSILRFNSEIDRLKETNITLDDEIIKTKRTIEDLVKGGEHNGGL